MATRKHRLSMTIRIYCDCGRKLAVGDDLAGRKTVCPACGASSSVPKRRKRIEPRDPTISTKFLEAKSPAPLDPLESQVTIGSHKQEPPRPNKPHRPRRVEWWECLFVPLDNWKFLLGFSFIGAMGAAFFAGVLQGELARGGATAASRLLGAFLVTVLPAAGLSGAFFSHVVSDPARVRKKADRHWALLSFEEGIIAFLRCLCCILCGPVLLVAAGAWYWTQRGGSELLDRIVMCEIAGLGGGWLAIQILLTSGRSWSGMLPIPVARAAWKLGWRGLLVSTAFGLLIGGLAPLWHASMIATSRGWHWTAFKSWFVLFTCGLTVGGMLLQLLGGWYSRIGTPIVDPLQNAPPPPPEFPIATPEALPETSGYFSDDSELTGRPVRTKGDSMNHVRTQRK